MRKTGGAVETLFDLCFGGSRAMLSSYRLRAGVDAVASLCFVLREGAGGGAVVGAIRYWPVNIVAGRVESVASDSGGSGVESVDSGCEICGFRERGLGIIAGDRSRYTQPIKAKGLGGVLIRHSLAEARLTRLDAGYFDRRCQLLRAVRVRPHRFGLPTANR